MKEQKICLITFSNNADHQNVIYSMFNVLYPQHEVFTIGIINPKSNIAPHTSNNYYVECPERPGIYKGTFNIENLLKIRTIIIENKIDLVYFESQHIWNMFIMLLCPFVKKVVAVHDVIPHDNNKSMILSNFVTSHLADHVVLRNQMYKDLLSSKYGIRLNKITSFKPWREYPDKISPKFSGIFLFFGRIRKYKGFDQFIKIIELTPEINYRIVGEPDDESKILVEHVKGFSNVTVIDYEVSDAQMSIEFTNADWIVLPYSSATQSGVITDAYRYARPVIVFDIGAIKEQVEDGKTGFLVDAGDIDGFANKILEISKYRKEQLEKFSNNAYNFGYRTFSSQYNANRFISLLNNI